MSELNKKSETTRFFIIISSFFCFFLITYSLVNRHPRPNNNYDTNSTLSNTTSSNISNNLTETAIFTTDSIAPSVNIFNHNNISKESARLYKSLSCKKTDLNLTLCGIDGEKAARISDVRKNILEKKIIDFFKDKLVNKSDHVVLDLGAKEGKYGLVAAKFGHDVLFVEPLLQNILKIHKAAQIENLNDKMTLVKNKISNKRSIFPNKMIKPIVLDDLINYLPKNRFNQSYKNAIVKIDMNQTDFKPIRFDTAGSLFKNINVNFMLMKNWKNSAIEKNNDKLFVNQIQKMILFLNKNNLTAYDLDGGYLNKEKWMYWPNNIAWVKTNNLTRLNF